MHLAAHDKVRAVLGEAQRMRAAKPPMRWQVKPLAMLKSVAPKMDEGSRVTLRKDKNVADRDEVERRQLKRQIARERRGAKRELRRDADFLARERQREDDDKKAERKAAVRKNMAWLQEQQATVNLQVKKGGSLLKGGGSGFKKRPKIK
uniref:Uncharacterized protein n=1 Tax=Phaeomonas parva TaxID=124430 RepID=A0A7S1UH76_9STRA